MTWVWIQFGISALIVVIAGIRLARYADVIARGTGIGALWVGSLLLAGATSLPEIVTSVSSGLLDVPDIAVGNVFGSNIFNVFIIAVADLFDGHGSILRKVLPGHLLTAMLGMLLSAVAAVSILMQPGVMVLGVGADTLTIALVYLFGLRLIYRFGRRTPEEQGIFVVDDADPPPVAQRQAKRLAKLPDVSLARAYTMFALAAVAVVVAGTTLTHTGDIIAETTGLGHTFVGSFFVAAATSLPEVVTITAAVLAGNFDMAIGNVLGSNIFNMVILLLADVSYQGGPILSVVSQAHAIVALFGLILSSIVVVGLFYRSRRSYAYLGPDSIIIILVYLLATYLIFLNR